VKDARSLKQVLLPVIGVKKVCQAMKSLAVYIGKKTGAGLRELKNKSNFKLTKVT